MRNCYFLCQIKPRNAEELAGQLYLQQENFAKGWGKIPFRFCTYLNVFYNVCFLRMAVIQNSLCTNCPNYKKIILCYEYDYENMNLM